MEGYPVPSEIVKCLDSLIMGQTDEKQKLALGLYNHCISLDSRARSVYQIYRPNNLVIVGPNGLGKEQLFTSIAALLNVPYAIYDCKGIKDFDTEMITELLQKSASLWYGDEDDDDFYQDEISTCIVFLDNIDLTDQSFNPDFNDLMEALQAEFESCSFNTKATKLLFLCVISPSDDELNVFERHKNELKMYLDSLFKRDNIRDMIEETSCIYLTTRDTDLVARSGLINDSIIGYRQWLTLHKTVLEFTDEATAHMSRMEINELNETLNHIFSLAMYKIPGSKTNVVQVTLNTITERRCPNLIKREM